MNMTGKSRTRGPKKNRAIQRMQWSENTDGTFSFGLSSKTRTNPSAKPTPVAQDRSIYETSTAMTINGGAQTHADSATDAESEEEFTYDELFGTRADDAPENGQLPDYLDRSLDENDVEMEFYRGDDSVMIRCHEKEFYVGTMDLTETERLKLMQLSEVHVRLTVDLDHVIIDRHNVLDIRRIGPRVVQPDSSFAHSQLSAKINLVRIQFSVSEPLLARYADIIYTVGPRLHCEYVELIEQTTMSFGTVALKLNKNRIICDDKNRVIDVTTSHTFAGKKICLIRGKFAYDDEFEQNCGPLCDGLSRYVLNDKPDISLEKVDVKLIFASEHDDCDEIYAEPNYLFNEKPAKKDDCPVAAVTKKMKRVRIKPERIDSPDDERMKMIMLKQFPVPAEISEIERNNITFKELMTGTRFGHLFKNNARSDQTKYIAAFRILIWLDQEAQLMFLEQFNTHVKLSYYMGLQFTFPITNALAEIRAAIDENNLDRFTLTPKQTHLKNSDDLTGQICFIRDDRVFVEMFPASFKKLQKIYQFDTFDITFQLNSTPYQLQHTALDYIEGHNLFNVLIDNPLYRMQNTQFNAPSSLPATIQREGTLFTGLNKEQQQTVESILSKPDNLPYVLYGPPGTGKTRTIVAAIEQAVRTTDKCVLVCAMSNSACDEIAERLAQVLEPHEVYRMYARSFRHGNMSELVKRISNWSRSGIRTPSLKRLYEYRVVCTTLCTAGCFSRAHIDRKVWRADHFGFVFIDECASSSETMALIPVAGVCTSSGTVHAKIVVAGDPKQLDAITRSQVAQRLGYKCSWLEQLTKFDLYKSNRGRFNPNYISMLVKNYRSHPDILNIPNQLFYNGRLEALAPPSITNWYIRSSILPSKQFPIIFKSVQGRCERSGADASLFNKKEIDEVVDYVKKLLKHNNSRGLRKIKQTDIGVVTPYKKQCWKLNGRFHFLGYNDITVGTSEVFQGKEKPVMIVTTVRADGQSLGFVKEKRRLNVMLTRAKCLLIVIGDPHTLRLDRCWLRFLEFCLENGGFIQSNKPFPEQ